MDKIKITDMIHVVKDAGMYDENMSKNDLINYYKAITDSKDTSIAKNEARKCEDDSASEVLKKLESHSIKSIPDKDHDSYTEEGSFKQTDVFQPKTSPKTSSSYEKNIDKEKSSPENSLTEKTNLDATQANFGFHDMPKPTESSLKINYRHPKFTSISNSRKFLEADILTKAKMLYSYHTKIDKLKSKLARQSFFPVSKPKPILLREIYTPSLDMENDFEETFVRRSGEQTKKKFCTDYNEENFIFNKKSMAKSEETMPKHILLKEICISPSLDMEYDFEETYVSRSGRQTKRKLYTDYNEDSSGNSLLNKKSKAKSKELNWTSTTKSAGKATTKKSEITTKLEITSKSESISISEPVQKLKTKEEAMEIKKSDVVQKETPKSRSKILINAEILSKTSLFPDPPNRRLKRCEVMFEKLIEETETKRKEKKSLEASQKILDSLEQTESQTNDNVVSTNSIARRVIPPIPMKKKAIGSGNKQEKAIIPPSISVDRPKTCSHKDNLHLNDKFFEPSSLLKKQKSVKFSSTETFIDATSTTYAGSSTDVVCPICSKMFPEASIVKHAASCGEKQTLTRYSSKQKLSCEICDKVIFEDYALHVMECKRHHEELSHKRK